MLYIDPKYKLVCNYLQIFDIICCCPVMAQSIYILHLPVGPLHGSIFYIFTITYLIVNSFFFLQNFQKIMQIIINYKYSYFFFIFTFIFPSNFSLACAICTLTQNFKSRLTKYYKKFWKIKFIAQNSQLFFSDFVLQNIIH